MIYLQAINSDRFRLRSVIVFGAHNIFIDREPQNEYEQLQLELGRLLCRNVLLSLAAVIFSYSILLTGPIFGYFYYHVYAIPTGTILPLIDPDTFNGFMANVFVQGVAGVIGMLGITGIETLIGVASGTMVTMSKLTIFRIRKFSKNIEKGNGNHLEFLNILYMTEDIMSYSSALNSIFFWRALFQPTFTTLCASVCILCHYAVSQITNNKIEHFKKF